jgi:putative glycosyltransferase (TIGR04372 family)
MFSKNFLNLYRKYIKNNIKKKGFTYVLNRLIKKIISFEAIIIYPIVFLLCLFIKIIKPIFFIRFGCLYTAKFGPLVTRSEMNLCEQDNGLQPEGKKTFNIYNNGPSSFICNKQLYIMWKRILRVYPRSRYFWNVMNSFTFGYDHVIKTKQGSRDIHNLLEKSPIHISFSKKEIAIAKKQLLKMGIQEKDKYILMINRTERYWNSLPGNMGASHDTHRNTNINALLPIAENLTSKGYTIIRFGREVGDLMKTKNPKIIEYDHGGFATDLLDIYLSANCKYVIGTSDTGGMASAGWNFRKPLLNVNFSQLENLIPWLPSWLFIFQKYWLKYEKRFMSVKEMITSGAGRFDTTKQFEERGIELIKNTPKQIIDVFNEMEKRLEGNWKVSEEDEELQKRFWFNFQSSDRQGKPRSKIGANFLRENKDIL